MEERLDLEAIRTRLCSWFEGKLSLARELTLSPLIKPVSGASNQTYFTELRWRQDDQIKSEDLVIRWIPKGFSLFPKYDIKEQFLLIRQLEQTGVPVPRTRWFEDDESVLGVPFYVMDRVHGWSPGDFPPYHVAGNLYEATPQAKAQIWWEAVDTLAKIHTLDWEKEGLGFLGVPKIGADSLERQIAYYEQMLQMNMEPPPPILEATRDWLKANIYVPKHVSLCWGDAKLSNLIYCDNKIKAVLDWEMAFLGDPESDLAWLLHMDWSTSEGRPYSPSPRLEGLPDKKETIAHYEQVANRKVENFFYHEVFAAWRLAVVCARTERSPWFMARNKNSTTDLTWTQFEKLRNLLNL